MPTKLPRERVVFYPVDPHSPTIIGPPMHTDDINTIEERINRHKKMYKERGHKEIDIEKITKRRVLRDKWNADILRAYPYLRRDNPLERSKTRNYGTKEYAYDNVDAKKIARCVFDEKTDKFECHRIDAKNRA